MSPYTKETRFFSGNLDLVRTSIWKALDRIGVQDANCGKSTKSVEFGCRFGSKGSFANKRHSRIEATNREPVTGQGSER